MEFTPATQAPVDISWIPEMVSHPKACRFPARPDIFCGEQGKPGESTAAYRGFQVEEHKPCQKRFAEQSKPSQGLPKELLSQVCTERSAKCALQSGCPRLSKSRWYMTPSAHRADRQRDEVTPDCLEQSWGAVKNI